jgi:hypothetical protein
MGTTSIPTLKSSPLDPIGIKSRSTRQMATCISGSVVVMEEVAVELQIECAVAYKEVEVDDSSC